ncbi:MAG: GGDEF domain-containing protein [Acidimicrobiales bacterium]|nr:GGDEF domain-containing protein [Acidimicrobiales bacterium]
MRRWTVDAVRAVSGMSSRKTATSARAEMAVDQLFTAQWRRLVFGYCVVIGVVIVAIAPFVEPGERSWTFALVATAGYAAPALVLSAVAWWFAPPSTRRFWALFSVGLAAAHLAGGAALVGLLTGLPTGWVAIPLLMVPLIGWPLGLIDRLQVTAGRRTIAVDLLDVVTSLLTFAVPIAVVMAPRIMLVESGRDRVVAVVLLSMGCLFPSGAYLTVLQIRNLPPGTRQVQYLGFAYICSSVLLVLLYFEQIVRGWTLQPVVLAGVLVLTFSLLVMVPLHAHNADMPGADAPEADYQLRLTQPMSFLSVVVMTMMLVVAARSGDAATWQLWTLAVSLLLLLTVATLRQRAATAEALRFHRELEEANAALRDLALHDPLTGAANRALVFDRLANATSRAARTGGKVGLLFCDLDGFKLINDRFGHEAGDAVLVEVVARIQDVVRASDLVGRVGGDEFVVVLEAIEGVDKLQAVAQRVVEVVCEPIVLDQATVTVGVSVGAAVVQSGCSAEEALRLSDRAMYRAKASSGRSPIEVIGPAS